MRRELARQQMQQQEESSARIIQSYFRRFLVRKRRQWELKQAAEQQAALCIQRWWSARGILRYLSRRRRAATTLQAVWRGQLTRMRLAHLASMEQQPPRQSYRGMDRLNTKDMQHLLDIRRRLGKVCLNRSHSLKTRAMEAVQFLQSGRSALQLLTALRCLGEHSFSYPLWCSRKSPMSVFVALLSLYTTVCFLAITRKRRDSILLYALSASDSYIILPFKLKISDNSILSYLFCACVLG